MRLWLIFVTMMSMLFLSTVFGEEHIIRGGDTLYSISKRYGVTVDTLLERNPHVRNKPLSIGEKLLIPKSYAFSDQQEFRYHSVQKGDTLYSIARKYNLQVPILTVVNNLETSVIREGMQLKIPIKITSQESAIAGNLSIPSKNNLVSTVTSSSATNQWPAQGEIKKSSGKFPGVVITTKAGEVGKSVAAGRVTYAAPHAIYGSIVFIRNTNGYLYVYAGLSNITVSVGEMVEVGAKLGIVTPRIDSSLPQLLFSVWRNDLYVDPNFAPRG